MRRRRTHRRKLCLTHLKEEGETKKEEGDGVVSDITGGEDGEGEGGGVELRDPVPAAEPAEDKEDWKWVCRPKVGDLIVGGGFLAVFRKMKYLTPADN